MLSHNLFKKKIVQNTDMKCEVCDKSIAKTFLDKIKGTYVKDAKGKQRAICFECQSKLKDKASLLQHLK